MVIVTGVAKLFFVKNTKPFGNNIAICALFLEFSI